MTIRNVTGKERISYFPFVPGMQEEGGIFLVAGDESNENGLLYADGEGDDLIIRHIYVAEEKRREGIGNALLFSLQTMGSALGCERITVSYVSDGDTASLDGFFTAAGFEKMKQGSLYAMTLSDVYDAIEDIADERVSCDLVFLKDLSSKGWYALQDRLHEMASGDQDDNKLWMVLKNRDRYMGESIVALSEDGVPQGCLMISSVSKTEILIDYVCTFGNNRGRLLLSMLRQATDAVADSYPFNTGILCHAYNPVSAGIIKKLGIRKASSMGDAMVYVREI